METLPEDAKIALLDFCSRHELFAKSILPTLEAKPALVPRNTAAAVAILDIYELSGSTSLSSLVRWAVDVLADQRTRTDQSLRHRLQQAAIRHGIEHQLSI
ncbi:peptide ABC transporter permease, putative [Babesia ovata]|uniref:Peptide ABC transporter permease, putative n=1 Tax=Babesia ovata TaxID=189622 RepID=A0A2H6KD73_9APIC|nr:peptide ABC transporter permease, putative [Babesia ovata]GBE60941.1 peptide ABC transporter permease, putative [Babesia ovata]